VAEAEARIAKEITKREIVNNVNYTPEEKMKLINGGASEESAAGNKILITRHS
jgi:hypothetical protein